MWRQGQTQMGGCFLSAVTVCTHTHKQNFLHNNPAKTSWVTDIIKCWQDSCVHYSNAVLQSQRWVFRTMPSLINQVEALTMLPRWGSCCSLDLRKPFLENWRQQFTAKGILILFSWLSHWEDMKKLHCKQQKHCDAPIRMNCVAVCGFGVSLNSMLWNKKQKKKRKKRRHVKPQNPTDNWKLLCFHILKKMCQAFKAS